MLQDRQARVFERQGNVYACALPDGRTRELSNGPSDIDLVGRYVGSEQSLPGTRYSQVVILDALTGHTAAFATDANPDPTGTAYIGGFVLNAHGTAVAIVDEGSCGPDPNSCATTSTVFERSVHGAASQPAAVTNSNTTAPITSIGLSANGTVAYWLVNGKYGGASLR
jgi:hypothetical protein